MIHELALLLRELLRPVARRIEANSDQIWRLLRLTFFVAVGIIVERNLLPDLFGDWVNLVIAPTLEVVWRIYRPTVLVETADA